MHQPQQAGTAAHRLPITRLEAAQVHRLQELVQGHRQGLVWGLQLAIGTEAMLQLFQQFCLFPQGSAAP